MHSHSGRGQVSVLILESSVQCQPSLLLVFRQQGDDAQSVLVGVAWLHCLSVKDEAPTHTLTYQYLMLDICFGSQISVNLPKLFAENTLGVFVC